MIASAQGCAQGYAARRNDRLVFPDRERSWRQCVTSRLLLHKAARRAMLRVAMIAWFFLIENAPGGSV
jgi:hypothetical protein